MAFLTKSAYAKLAGVSRQNIYKMCELGHLTMRPDGKLDTEDRTNKNYLSKKDRPDGIKDSDKQKVKPNIKPKKKTTKPKKQEEKIIDNDNISDFIEDDGDDSENQFDKYKLQCKKIDADIKRVNVITKEKEQGLIDRDFVSHVFRKLHAIDSRELLQLPAKTAPDITAILGVDDPTIQIQIEQLLEKEIYQLIDRCKKELNTFLKKVKSKTDIDGQQTA